MAIEKRLSVLKDFYIKRWTEDFALPEEEARQMFEDLSNNDEVFRGAEEVAEVDGVDAGIKYLRDLCNVKV